MKIIILDESFTPAREVAQFGITAVAIYCLMYESAFMDKRFDKRRNLPWRLRQDLGGLCRWSHKAMSETLSIGKKTLLDKIDLLLDAGYIQVEGMEMGSKVSYQRIYRVTHPNALEARRAAIELMPEKPSITAKKKAKYFNEKHHKDIHDPETSEYSNDSNTI
jgi:hypothetical protein